VHSGSLRLACVLLMFGLAICCRKFATEAFGRPLVVGEVGVAVRCALEEEDDDGRWCFFHSLLNKLGMRLSS
jgi:hypothetical protein